MTELVRTEPTQPAISAPPPDYPTPADWVTDITCTEPGCGRAMTVTVLEVLLSRPCPLCKACPDCRRLCATGQVEHGLAPEALL